MSDSITFKGKPFNLNSKIIEKKSPLPDCELTNESLQPVKLSSFKGKALLLLTVPSLDTSVCSLEAARFNKEISAFKNDLNAVVISMDLPFAQKRWCGSENITNLKTLSDFKNHDAGNKLGVFIPELGLLARAVFICDADLIVQEVFLVPEVTHEPNYSEVMEKLKQTLSK